MYNMYVCVPVIRIAIYKVTSTATNPPEARDLVVELRQRMLELSMDRFGCRVVQKLLGQGRRGVT